MKIRSPLLNKLIAKLAVLSMRGLFATCRTEVVFKSPESSCYEPPAGDERYAYCLWHDGIALASFAKRPLNCAILVSRHNDGSLLANALKSLGMKPIRGSSSKGGARAARQVIEDTRELHFTVTPDGPRGPRREVKEGIVFLASKTQHPVVPTYALATREWQIKGSWTDMALPKPFARCYLFGGEPIHVPEKLDREQIAEYRNRLQAEMERVERIAKHYAETGELNWTLGENSMELKQAA